MTIITIAPADPNNPTEVQDFFDAHPLMALHTIFYANSVYVLVYN